MKALRICLYRWPTWRGCLVVWYVVFVITSPITWNRTRLITAMGRLITRPVVRIRVSFPSTFGYILLPSSRCVPASFKFSRSLYVYFATFPLLYRSPSLNPLPLSWSILGSMSYCSTNYRRIRRKNLRLKISRVESPTVRLCRKPLKISSTNLPPSGWTTAFCTGGSASIESRLGT